MSRVILHTKFLLGCDSIDDGGAECNRIFIDFIPCNASSWLVLGSGYVLNDGKSISNIAIELRFEFFVY